MAVRRFIRLKQAGSTLLSIVVADPTKPEAPTTESVAMTTPPVAPSFKAKVCYLVALLELLNSTEANGGCSLLLASKRFERYSVSFLVKWCILVALMSTLE